MRAALLLLLAFGCHARESIPVEKSVEKPIVTPSPAARGVGRVEGVVVMNGTPPKMEEIKRSSDPYCAKTKVIDPEVIVRDGKLANVLIAIHGAPASAPPAAAALLDQK